MRKILLAIAAVVFSSFSQAANVETELPDNAFITIDGVDWAWAYPLPPNGNFDLGFQSQFGWRIPTADELALAPDATDFMFAGANVPLGGIDPVSGARFQATNANLVDDAACATPYFSNSFLHCDWQDGNGQTYEPWCGLPGAEDFCDQLVIRGSIDLVPVPSLSQWSMVILCLILAGFAAARLRAA